jgi:hypothetical protein
LWPKLHGKPTLARSTLAKHFCFLVTIKDRIGLAVSAVIFGLFAIPTPQQNSEIGKHRDGNAIRAQDIACMRILKPVDQDKGRSKMDAEGDMKQREALSPQPNPAQTRRVKLKLEQYPVAQTSPVFNLT